MSDDLRKRAARQATYGNYWAGKCVGLLDEIERLLDELAEVKADRQRLVQLHYSTSEQFTKLTTFEGVTDD